MMEMPEGWKRFAKEVETSRRYSIGLKLKNGAVVYPELIETMISAVSLMKEMAEALEEARREMEYERPSSDSSDYPWDVALKKFKEWK